MRRVFVLIPLCALVFSPGASDGPKSKEGEVLIPFVDDGGAIPKADDLETVAKKDPVAFLEHCLRKYQREVKGYRCVMQKQERLDGKLLPSEEIEVTFRQDPYSALLRWKKGARLADSALYVEGENTEKDKSQMLVHPAGIAGRLVKSVSRDPRGEEAGKSGRYYLTDFGIEKGTQRTLDSWKKARDDGKLTVEFLGETKLKEAGDRTCYKLRRTDYAKPEEDGVLELTIYIDKETLLQVGSVLKGNNDSYIAQYYFRDIKLNPEFTAETFKKEALTK
jgi:hypothetical protein